MIRIQRDRGIQRRLPVGEGFAGSSVDQVDADVESGILRGVHRGANVLRLMCTVKGRQHVRYGRLHTDGQPRHSGIRQRARHRGRHGIRIRLDGDLGSIGDTERRNRGVHHPRQIAGREQRRGSSTEEHGVHRPQRAGLAEHASCQGDLGAERVGVLVLTCAAQLSGGIRVEVAVSAANPAERYVQIRRERRTGIDHEVVGEPSVNRCCVAERQRSRHQSGVA